MGYYGCHSYLQIITNVRAVCLPYSLVGAERICPFWKITKFFEKMESAFGLLTTVAQLLALN